VLATNIERAKKMDDERPFDLRDKLAIEILNGVLSHSKSDTGNIISNVVHYISYDSESDGQDKRRIEEVAAKQIERTIRACYKVADIMRRVRLSAFE
jgi:hypothetical protein